MVNDDSEAQRLKALRELKILDTPRDPLLDDLVDLVALICDTPMAAISLVDENRQWFKAAKGLGVCQTPKNVAFCAHAIESDAPFVVSDASTDERFATNPLVEGGPSIRFYYGIPLVISSGHRIGTLCVIDNKPRELNPTQIKTMAVIAKQITDDLEREANDRRRLEAEKILERQKVQIASSSKMSALGEMASSIAHEINNPLAAILVRAGLLTEMADGGELNREAIKSNAEAIEATSIRISKTVKALRSFARDGENDPFEPTSLALIFTDTLEFCRERFKQSQVELKVDMPPPDLKIICRGVQVTQVLLNLLNNAFDAIADLDQKFVHLGFIERPNNQIELFVQNCGAKISPEVQARITQPFFTTKPAGKGTGLGLSISQRILHAHHSHLEIDRECPETRFFFRLPYASTAAPNSQ